MGWNSVAVILHDFLHEIREDKDIGKDIDKACCDLNGHETGFIGDKESRWAGGQGIQVIDSFHADLTSIVAVGGNCGTVISRIPNVNAHTEEGKIKILKQFAKELGYRVVKKPL